MTTFVVEPTSVSPTTGQAVPVRPSGWDLVTRRHLGATGVGEDWRCLVAGGQAPAVEWLEARVGETGVVATLRARVRTTCV
ncbi:MAG: hypothetical protein ACRDZ3_15415 [Acidimicrobiia bacterium]